MINSAYILLVVIIPFVFSQLIFLRCGLKQTSTLARRLMMKQTATSSESTTTRLTQLCL